MAEGMNRPAVMQEQADWQEEQVQAAKEALREGVRILVKIRQTTGGSRELSTAQTNAETALLWLKAHGHDGRWAE